MARGTGWKFLYSIKNDRLLSIKSLKNLKAQLDINTNMLVLPDGNMEIPPRVAENGHLLINIRDVKNENGQNTREIAL